MLCNLRSLRARLRLRYKKLAMAQQPEPRFKQLKLRNFSFSEWPITSWYWLQTSAARAYSICQRALNS